MTEPDQRSEIVNAYVNAVLEHGHFPPSVYAFCKELDLSESDFYLHFSSFRAVESAVWADMLEATVERLDADGDFADYGASQKVLAALYTLLEEMLPRRSFILVRFPGVKPRDAVFKKMLCRYNHLIKDWIEEGIDRGDIAKRGRLTELYAPVFSLHLLTVIDFWLKDESEQFQRTDAYVEKTVAFVGELIRTQAADAAADLARFLAGARRA